MDELAAAGYDVYALDFLGYGGLTATRNGL